jgi:hypothetical protein
VQDKGDSLLRFYYDSGVKLYINEVDGLFRRFYCFLFSLAFLVTAFAASLLSDASCGTYLAMVVAIFGTVVSFTFLLINDLNSVAVRQRRNYLTRIEDYLDPQRALVVLPPLKQVSREREWLQKIWWVRLPKKWKVKLDNWFWDNPSSHTFLIPAFFLFCWPIAFIVVLIVRDP